MEDSMTVFDEVNEKASALAIETGICEDDEIKQFCIETELKTFAKTEKSRMDENVDDSIAILLFE
jgi:hypothetical protein